jgi:hypothetical protein
MLKNIKVEVVDNDSNKEVANGCVIYNSPKNVTNTNVRKCCDSRFKNCIYYATVEIETDFVMLNEKICLFNYRKVKT